MIKLSPAAARQINATLEDEVEELSLRVAARLADDGSVEYALGLDLPREGDFTLEEKGVPLLIGPSSRALLSNTRIDYVEYEPGDFRFIFVVEPPDPASAGPSAQESCGSGGCARCSSSS